MPLLGEVLERIAAGGIDARRQARGFGGAGETLGDALAVAGLRAVDDRQARADGLRRRDAGDGDAAAARPRARS